MLVKFYWKLHFFKVCKNSLSYLFNTISNQIKLKTINCNKIWLNLVKKIITDLESITNINPWNREEPIRILEKITYNCNELTSVIHSLLLWKFCDGINAAGIYLFKANNGKYQRNVWNLFKVLVFPLLTLNK